jgi:ribosome-binding protein aMBF1 (putative translation factor)
MLLRICKFFLDSAVEWMYYWIVMRAGTGRAKAVRSPVPAPLSVPVSLSVPVLRRRKCYTVSDVTIRLKNAVDAAGSQSAFAESVGISQPMLSQILKGVRTPSVQVLERLGLVEVRHYEEAAR